MWGLWSDVHSFGGQWRVHFSCLTAAVLSSRADHRNDDKPLQQIQQGTTMTQRRAGRQEGRQVLDGILSPSLSLSLTHTHTHTNTHTGTYIIFKSHLGQFKFCHQRFTQEIYTHVSGKHPVKHITTHTHEHIQMDVHIIWQNTSLYAEYLHTSSFKKKKIQTCYFFLAACTSHT